MRRCIGVILALIVLISSCAGSGNDTESIVDVSATDVDDIVVRVDSYIGRTTQHGSTFEDYESRGFGGGHHLLSRTTDEGREDLLLVADGNRVTDALLLKQAPVPVALGLSCNGRSPVGLISGDEVIRAWISPGDVFQEVAVNELTPSEAQDIQCRIGR